MSMIKNTFRVRDYKYKPLLAATIVILSSFLFVQNASAQGLFYGPSVPQQGVVGGIGTHFAITNSSYLNITLDSSASVRLRMDSTPAMITMLIDPVSVATSTQITLSGFATSTTYYRYQDNYHNETAFTTSVAGTYSYVQDLSTPHYVFIQSQKGTKFIIDNATGGDCIAIGTWNPTTKTCTLTTNVSDELQIDSDNVTLDGNGHTLNGNNSVGHGILLGNRAGVTIKNLIVTGFNRSISLFASHNNTIIDNTVSFNFYGFFLASSTGNTITTNTGTVCGACFFLERSNGNTLRGNTVARIPNTIFTSAGVAIQLESSHQNIIEGNAASEAGFGIALESSNVNTVTGNTVNANNSHGIFIKDSDSNTLRGNVMTGNLSGNFNLRGENDFDFINTIDTTNTVDGKAVYYVRNVSNQTFDAGTNAGVLYCIDCSDIVIKNLELTRNHFGIYLRNTTRATIDRVTIPFQGIGIYLHNSPDVTITNSTILDSISGLVVGPNSYNATIYHNNFINLTFDFGTFPGTGAVFTLPKPIGGNYWDKFDTPEEGCFNVNPVDDFCDSTYGFDTLPWVRPIVAEKTLSEKAAELAKELVNQPQGYLLGGKGWDYGRSEWITSSDILASTGYEYLRGLRAKGVDCSGLITWAFNRAFNPFLSADYNFVQYVNANGLHSEPQSDFIAEANILSGDAMFFDWGKFNPVTQKWEGPKDGYIDHTAMYVGESGGYDVVNASSEAVGIVPETKDIYKLITGFDSFRRIHQANVEMEVVAASPVDLIVTDPAGFAITPNSLIPSDEEFIREVPGVLYYLEMEKGHDGRPVDRVYSPTLKTGNYIIKVMPEIGTLPTETYKLEFRGREQTIILANNVSISQIPIKGYGVAVGETGAISTFVPVAIDIKPGSFPNSINLGSGGTVPVAIFGTTTFNISQIDPATITLANASVKFKGNGQPMASYQDVNGDSITDIVVHVTTEALQLTETDVQAELNGFLLDGRNIKGSDSIRVVP